MRCVRDALDMMLARSGAALEVRAAVLLVRSILITRLSPSLRAAREHKEGFYRQMWAAAAADVGAPVRHLADGSLEITIGAGSLYADGPGCSIDSADAVRTAADKARVYGLLAADGLPVPPHRVFSLRSLGQGQDFLSGSARDCVVKAACGTAGGVGVTAGVRDVADLRRAVAAAAAAGARAGSVRRRSRVRRLVEMFRGIPDTPLLIEHQVKGHNYRLLYLDSVLVDALRRDPPTVTGDGQSTVLALLDRLNRDRLRAGGHHAQALVNRDFGLDKTLAEQGFSVSSVPASGVQVRLKTAINENAPENNVPARNELCAAIIEQGARAAELVGARFVGVDVIAPDPAAPLADSGGCVLEVNIPPGLAMHYTAQPAAVEPAKVLLHRLLAVSASSQPE